MPDNQQGTEKYAGAFNVMPLPAAIICGAAPAILNEAAQALIPNGGQAWFHKLPGLSGYVARRSAAEFGAVLPSGTDCIVEIRPIQSGGVLITVKPGEMRSDLATPENLPYKSEAMTAVIERMGRMSLISSPVLLTGEPGCGKESLARAIHRRGLRGGRPFIVVECGLPKAADRLEAVLFGQNGAPGVLEAVSDGVLYISEAHKLPRHLQKRLAGVMKSRSLQRQNAEIPLKARIMAASSRDLRRMAANGEFLQELYLGLAAFTVELPPLRERTEDIMPIAEYAASKIAFPAGGGSAVFSEGAAAKLTAYSWPLNVRELIQVASSAALARGNGVIGPEDISTGSEAMTLGAMTAEFQRGRIKAAIDLFGGGLSGKKMAAKTLGIGLSTLYRLLAEKT